MWQQTATSTVDTAAGGLGYGKSWASCFSSTCIELGFFGQETDGGTVPDGGLDLVCEACTPGTAGPIGAFGRWSCPDGGTLNAGYTYFVREKATATFGTCNPSGNVFHLQVKAGAR
jgi:hypothetical protein